jgi:hypothetical protein
MATKLVGPVVLENCSDGGFQDKDRQEEGLD